jgi:CRP/FNR family cyclic AMP-dependent transcriptional regulator
VHKAYLEGLPLFKDLTPEEKAELEALFEPASFEAGEAILKEDSLAKYLYVLTSGAVEVHKEVFPGRLQHLATIEAPTVVGEIGLMTEPRATATVTARDPVEARRLPREAFLKKLETDSVAAYKIVYEIGRILAERMARTDECVAKIVTQIEDAESNRDFDVFREKLLKEWSF